MEQVSVLGEFFYSQVQGRPIFDGKGRKVGHLRDMAVSWDGICPRVTGIKFARGVQKHIGISQIDHWDKQGLKLKGEFSEDNLSTLKENEIYAGKWLLDKQIIDMKGSKVVRVNDIKLSWIRHGETYDVILLAVDIGLRGLFRRLGVEFLGRKMEHQLLGWQYIKPLENLTASLRLRHEQDQISRLHPADIADIIEELDHRERAGFIDHLDNETAAEALAEADLNTQVEIIERMDSERASDILEEMPPDEAADILGELPEEKSRELLNLMEPEEAEDVRELMGYPDNTAGALMTTEYIAFPAGMTAEETINRLRELAPSAETIYYLYVINEEGILQGVISLRDLIISPPQATLGEFMRTRVVLVNHHDDHRKVLDAVTKYNLLAVPVVDDRGALLGIITVDDVLETMMPNRSGLDNIAHFMIRRRPVRGWKA